MFDARLLSGVSVMIAVVEAGSFVRAADALGLTPSGVKPGYRAAGDADRHKAIRSQPTRRSPH